MYKRLITLLLLCYLLTNGYLSHAQVGGRRTFDFLNMPSHARLWALGGVNVSSQHQDPHLFVSNPALLNDSTCTNTLSINHLGYVADIAQYNLASGIKFKKAGLLGLSMQYLNYGNIQGYDATGAPTNSFSNRDWAVGVSKSFSSNVYRLGGTLKLAGSSIANYNASGLFVDLGGAFVHPKQDFIIGFTFKNIGFLWDNYLPSSSFLMPFEAQIGVSYKASRMPIRFSLTAQQIGRSSSSADDPTKPRQLGSNGLPIQDVVSNTQKFIRHFVVGAELLLHRNFQVICAYNFLRRREMLVTARPATVGLSLGLQYRFRAFQLGASWTSQYVGNTGMNVSLAMNLSKLMRKR